MTKLIIHPEPASELKNLAIELLNMAGDKRLEVEYVMWPEPGFRVSEELFDKFVEARRNANEPVKTETPGVGQDDVLTEPGVVEVKRKPGRPKKIQEGQ